LFLTIKVSFVRFDWEGEKGWWGVSAENEKKRRIDEIDDLDRMLTISKAAVLLGVSPATLRRFANSNQIKAYRVGDRGHRRFRKRDVLALLK